MLYDNILVPYDGSPSARAALAEAVRFAKDDPGLTLSIVHIIDTEQLVIDRLEAAGRDEATVSSSDDLRLAYDEAVREADERLHRHIDGILHGLMNKVRIDILQETRPGDQIVAYAAEHACDLIVMGSRGLGALRGMIGSVSNQVLRQSDVPVLIVKHNAAE